MDSTTIIYEKHWKFDFYEEKGLIFLDSEEYNIEPMPDDENEYDETYVISGLFGHIGGNDNPYSLELSPEDYKIIKKKVFKHFAD